MLLTNYITIAWGAKNKKKLIQKGYKFTKIKDKITIKIEDLTKGSKTKVEVLCDYCLNTIMTPTYADYNNSKNCIINKDCCVGCRPVKIKEIYMEKYGVESKTGFIETQEKRKQTCLKKYGVNNPNKSKIVRNKTENTNLKLYGNKNLMGNEIIKEKVNKTIKSKYGVDNISQSDEIKEKKKKTCLINFGVEYPSQNKEVIKKIMINKAKTLYKNGNAPTSYPQTYINNILKGKLNYPVNRYNLDILLPSTIIYIECDLGGHNLNVINGQITQKEFDKNEMKRYYFLRGKGYKMIRIISTKDLLPLDEIILEMIDYAKEYLTSGHSWIKFDVDNEKIITSQFNINCDYGELRKITKNALELQLATN